MRSLRVGFLSSHNYLDRNAFSGTLYSMYQALLKQNIQVVPLGRAYTPNKLHKFARLFHKNTHSSLSVKNPNLFEDGLRFRELVKKQLKKNPCDVIFAPVGAMEVKVVDVDVPFVYLSDVTHELYLQLYGLNYTERQAKISSDAEKHAISYASQIIYSSRWAANSAMNHYGAPLEKTQVIPFGANLERVPSFEQATQREVSSKCRLLFVGKWWERKGGNIALECLQSLLELGVDADLTIVGCVPPAGYTHEKLNVIPFLDKNVPQQRQKLEELYFTSNFLLFPTRADCSPISICEANAYGLPVVASDVGGISSIIQEGVNGFMLPLSSRGDAYAKVIAKTFADAQGYRELVKAARQEYDDRLNWDHWAKATCQVFTSAVDQHLFYNISSQYNPPSGFPELAGV